MKINEFVDKYLLARAVSEAYARNLRKRAAKLSAFAGRADLTALFNEATVNEFLASRNGLAPHTLNKYRADLLAIWRAAADEDKVPYPMARRIRKARTVQSAIPCYLEHEARALAVAAEHLRGAYPNGVARRYYWPAAIRCAWDSGLRRGDVWRINLNLIRRDRTAQIVQSKTGKLILCRFHRSTLTALKKAGGHLEWVGCEWTFGEHFFEIVELSNVGRGTFKWLRRGSGSRIDADHPGRGHRHLGNTRQVFERHYDAQLSNGTQPIPPEL